MRNLPKKQTPKSTERLSPSPGWSLLRLKNFQKHRNRTIRLNPGLTVIAGNNGAGKSCLIRAFSSVALNTMSVNFIRRGTKQTVVKVKIDGHWIRRTRSASINSYTVDGERLVSFKTGVPDPATNILRIVPENIQRQGQAMFWLESSPGQVAKELNRLANCEVIDTAVSKLKQTQRAIAGRIDEVNEQHAEATEALEELKWVDRAHLLFEKIEHRTKLHVEKLAILEDIKKHIAIVEEQDLLLRRTSEKDIEGTMGRLEIIRDAMMQTSQSLSGIAKTCQSIQKEKNEQERLLNQQAEIQEQLKHIRQCPLCQSPINQWR